MTTDPYKIQLEFRYPDSENEVVVFMTQPSTCSHEIGIYNLVDNIYTSSNVKGLKCPYNLLVANQYSSRIWFISQTEKAYGTEETTLAVNSKFEETFEFQTGFKAVVMIKE